MVDEHNFNLIIPIDCQFSSVFFEKVTDKINSVNKKRWSKHDVEPQVWVHQFFILPYPLIKRKLCGRITLNEHFGNLYSSRILSFEFRGNFSKVSLYFHFVNLRFWMCAYVVVSLKISISLPLLSNTSLLLEYFRLSFTISILIRNLWKSIPFKFAGFKLFHRCLANDHWYILIFMRPHLNTREFSASSTPFPPNLYKRKWIHKHKCIYPLPLSRKNKWTIRYYTILLLLYLRRIDLFISPIEVVWILPQFCGILNRK